MVAAAAVLALARAAVGGSEIAVEIADNNSGSDYQVAHMFPCTADCSERNSRILDAVLMSSCSKEFLCQS